MCVQRFDDFDRMVASDDGQYVLFEDYDLLDKQCEQLRATLQQLGARVKVLSEQVNDFHCRLTEKGNHGAALLRLDDLLQDEAEDLGVDDLDSAPDSA